MILLEEGNRCVQEALESRIAGFRKSEKAEPIDVQIADFDGVVFHIFNGDSKNKIRISIAMKCYKDLQENGVDKVINDLYKSYVVDTETGFDLTLEIDLSTLPEKTEDIVKSFSMLKHNLICAAFNKVFDDMDSGAAPPLKPITIHYRDNESFYIKPEKDRLCVVFDINFSDPDDIVFAKVFLQEFADARRTVKNAPSVSYSNKEAPRELKDLKVKEGDNIGFVSFVLFPGHIEKKNRQNSLDHIIKFRNYLQYHIKCSKAYMHTRMRSRVESLLLVLNRAKPEPIHKEKKTMSGRSFNRS
eukprot:GCRY01000602.1.p1 GENE.GCRY01000602.1~~GCRY01000602.1.p1  ORF type:complete len:301 (-),score=64.47 GCRY01000602.1:172-1074(-)